MHAVPTQARRSIRSSGTVITDGCESGVPRIKPRSSEEQTVHLAAEPALQSQDNERKAPLIYDAAVHNQENCGFESLADLPVGVIV